MKLTSVILIIAKECGKVIMVEIFYQFGNPYLTNIDLSHLQDVISNIQGVRVEPMGVVTDAKGTYSRV